MKRIFLKSVYDAFEYVMDHYYPYGLADMAIRKDSYIVISIQDTHTGGFGFEFRENEKCRGALTMYFDDIIRPVSGAVAFNEEMAEQILSFVKQHEDVETVMVHCYGGESRSRAVAGFLAQIYGLESKYFLGTGNPNELVYDTLKKVHERVK